MEAACREHLPYLGLTGCQTPEHITLGRFYAAHRAGRRQLFTRTVRMALRLPLVAVAPPRRSAGPDTSRQRDGVDPPP